MATNDVICRLRQTAHKLVLPYAKKCADFNGFIGFVMQSSDKEL